MRNRAIVVVILFFFSSFVVFAGVRDCIYCRASTHTSDFCNKRPEGSTNSKGLVLKNGRWVKPSSILAPARTKRDDTARTVPVANPGTTDSSPTPPDETMSENPQKPVGRQRPLSSSQSPQRDRSQIKKVEQSLAESEEQLASSKAEIDALKAQIEQLVEQVELLKQQSEYYEKYTKTLRAQLGMKPEDFKSFQPKK